MGFRERYLQEADTAIKAIKKAALKKQAAIAPEITKDGQVKISQEQINKYVSDLKAAGEPDPTLDIFGQ